tara:strand:+ start:512 stop:628 length:117 start_codon:yes stop_codon:yes gene_type:complete
MPNKKAKERKRKRRKLAIENKTRKRVLQKIQKEKRNAN